jgi:integrating conjugative element membrane protein (TIGR03745 family)
MNTTAIKDRPRVQKKGRQAFTSLRLKTASAMACVLLMISEAMAELPTTAAPSRGATDGNYIQTMQDYAYDIFIFLGLAVGTIVFFTVAKNTMGAYAEVQDGKGTWGQVGMQFGVGVLLLVFIIFLLSEAAGIL